MLFLGGAKMSKYIIYLGNTGSAHRIALFDSDNILARSIPVKDVTTLPEGVDYLNCIVRDGQVIPSLQGVKVFCSVPTKERPMYRGRQRFSIKDLWVDPTQEPKYCYGHKIHNENYISAFTPHWLLWSDKRWNIWDGMCRENNIYIIATVAVRRSSKRFNITDSILCMTSTGELHFHSRKGLNTLIKNNMNLIQVGTPELNWPSTYHSSILYSGHTPLVRIRDEEREKVLWHSLNKQQDIDKSKVIYHWWSVINGYDKAVCDLRPYSRAKVFGLCSGHNASILIFPESAEEIWLGLLKRCPDMKVVYIPPTVTKVYDIDIPKRNVQQMKFYSSSPAVAEFCAKYNVERKDCDNPEDMLSEFYKASSSDYISLDELAPIASLAGVESDRQGIGGTIWTAALFSTKVIGVASETLQEKYPVVDTCKGTYQALIQNINVKETRGVGSEINPKTGKFVAERTRLLAAAFTQFYPLCTTVNAVPKKLLEYEKFSLGEYTLYVGFNAFNPTRCERFKEYKFMYDAFVRDFDSHRPNHECLLVDAQGQVIHRFTCGDSIIYILLSLEGACLSASEPSGVLRYVDKLPSIYRWTYHSTEHEQVVPAIFSTFLVFAYKTKVSRRMLVGIDLHSGEIFTANYSTVWFGVTPHTIQNFYPSVNRLTQFTLHTEPRDLFAKDCVYNKV